MSESRRERAKELSEVWANSPEAQERILAAVENAEERIRERKREQAKLFTCQCPSFCYYHTRMSR